mgnify:CR=1 FL=1
MAGRPIQWSIECWVVRRREGGEDDVLLLHKPPSLAIPAGFWQPITGGIYEGETAGEACIREISEETGLRVQVGDLRRIDGQWEFDLPHQVIRKELYWVEVPEATDGIILTEHDGCRWVPVSAVEAELYWESNRLTWTAVRDCILRP